MQEDPTPATNHTVAKLARFLPSIVMFTNASISGAFFICASNPEKCGEYHV